MELSEGRLWKLGAVSCNKWRCAAHFRCSWHFGCDLRATCCHGKTWCKKENRRENRREQVWSSMKNWSLPVDTVDGCWMCRSSSFWIYLDLYHSASLNLSYSAPAPRIAIALRFAQGGSTHQSSRHPCGFVELAYDMWCLLQRCMWQAARMLPNRLMPPMPQTSQSSSLQPFLWRPQKRQPWVV